MRKRNEEHRNEAIASYETAHQSKLLDDAQSRQALKELRVQ